MSKNRINYESDFKLYERNLDGDKTTPFLFVYSTYGNARYEASFLDGVYKNCRRMEDGTLMVVFDNHGLPPSELKVKRFYYLNDSDFHDGICHLVTMESTGIVLVNGRTDTTEVVTEPAPIWAKLTYDDLTEEDKDDLVKHIDLSSLQGVGMSVSGKVNLSKSDGKTTLQNVYNNLPGNGMAYLLITDSRGLLPSTETHVTVEDSVRSLFTTESSLGANVGDVVLVAKLKVSLINVPVYRIIPLNDAKAASGSFPGAMGLESPWDKKQINLVPTAMQFPTREGWNLNINDCLDSGVYPWCTLGRPSGSTGAFTLIVKKSTKSDGNGFYTVEQTAYGREAELGQVWQRVIFQKNDSSDTQYGEWIRLDNEVTESGIYRCPGAFEGLSTNCSAEAVTSVLGECADFWNAVMVDHKIIVDIDGLVANVGFSTGYLIITVAGINYTTESTIKHIRLYVDTVTYKYGSISVGLYKIAPVNNLNSTSTTAALAANQGRILNEKITETKVINTSVEYGSEYYDDGEYYWIKNLWEQIISEVSDYKNYIDNNNVIFRNEEYNMPTVTFEFTKGIPDTCSIKTSDGRMYVGVLTHGSQISINKVFAISDSTNSVGAYIIGIDTDDIPMTGSGSDAESIFGTYGQLRAAFGSGKTVVFFDLRSETIIVAVNVCSSSDGIKITYIDKHNIYWEITINEQNWNWAGFSKRQLLKLDAVNDFKGSFVYDTSFDISYNIDSSTGLGMGIGINQLWSTITNEVSDYRDYISEYNVIFHNENSDGVHTTFEFIKGMESICTIKTSLGDMYLAKMTSGSQVYLNELNRVRTEYEPIS